MRTILIASYTLVLGPPAMLAAMIDRSGAWSLGIARLWVRAILATCRVRVDVSGLDRIPSTSPCVLMSNHQSFIDTAVLLSTFPGPIRFMAKRELARVPVFGWAMAMGGHLLVDRGNRAAVRATLARGVAVLEAGNSLCVFPEGSRSLDGQLSSFKNGGFQMAIEAGVPIVPASIVGSGALAPRTTLAIARGRVTLSYFPAVATRGLASRDRPELKRRVRESILAGLRDGAEPE